MKKKLFIAKMKDKEFVYADKEQKELMIAGKPAQIKKMKRKRKFVGWSRKGRPFTPKEYKRTYLKKRGKMSYGKYLQEFGRQYKSKRLRKALLK